MLYEISTNFNKTYDPNDGFSQLMNQLLKMYENEVKPKIDNLYIQFKMDLSDSTFKYI